MSFGGAHLHGFQMCSTPVALWLPNFATAKAGLLGCGRNEGEKKHDQHGTFQGIFSFFNGLKHVKTMEKNMEKHKNPMEQLSSWKFQPAPRNVSNSSSWAFELASAQGSGGFFRNKNIGPFGYGVQGCNARNLMLEATLECRNISLFTLYYTHTYIYIFTFIHYIYIIHTLYIRIHEG